MDGQKIETKSQKQFIRITHADKSLRIALELFSKEQEC